jgi:RND family efflux transporter MFP subunit
MFQDARLSLIAAAAAAFAAGCSATQAATPAPEDPAIPVRTAAVERGPFRHPLRAGGTIASKDTWDLAFKVGGLVAHVDVRDGELVKKGQVLAALDPTEVTAAMSQAREAFAKAERDRDRARLLSASGSIARASAEDAETAATVAAAALEAAAFNLRNATIRAPEDGWVDRRQVEPGEVVAPGRSVLRMSGRRHGFVVRAHLPGRDVLSLAQGDAARVTLDARPEQPMEGRVTEIARAAAAGTGTYQVEIALLPSPKDPLILAGLTVKVEIEKTVEAQGAVPLAALVEGDGAAGAVFGVTAGVARRIPVRIAFLDGDRAVLAAGVAGLDHVVTDGASRLSDGSSVRVVP